MRRKSLVYRKDNVLCARRNGLEINHIMTLPSGVDLSRKECVENQWQEVLSHHHAERLNLCHERA
ncbi:MAG: hypothetical protein V8T87_14175 [Victivallales bacterium]